MDALSHILVDIHLGKAEYTYISGHGDWLVNVPQQSAVVFYVVTAGQVHVYLKDRTVLLEAGGILVIPSGAAHQVGCPNPEHSFALPKQLVQQDLSFARKEDLIFQVGVGLTQAVVLAVRSLFDIEMSRPLLSALPECFLLTSEADNSAPPWLKLGLEFLGLETERTRPGRDTLLNRLANMFFIECVRDYVEQLPEESESWLTALRDPTLMAALGAIHDRPAHPWSVADLASIACMSRSSFAERFAEVIGQPPLSYLSAHRLRLAARQLVQSYESIARISERVGYASEAAFSQAFKRQYDMSPSQYRKDAKAENSEQSL